MQVATGGAGRMHASSEEGAVVRARREGVPEAELANMGERLRQARNARGLGLRTVARRLGVSPSLISQVETGRAMPSVSTLYALASELGVSLDELLFVDTIPALPERPDDSGADLPDQPLPARPVQRKDGRVRIRLGSGVVWERLTTESLRSVDFLFVTYEVDGASSPADAFQRHKGQEFGYVLSGTLRLNIGFDEHLLGPGDAITFDSAMPHRLSNAGDVPVTAVWFVLGRRPSEGAPEDGAGS
jgi:transcriptional regulator with XRE-family HTH domain